MENKCGINKIIDRLENIELKECEQAKKYLSKFNFPEVVEYLTGYEDALKLVVEILSNDTDLRT